MTTIKIWPEEKCSDFGANKIMAMFYWYVQKLLMNIKKFWANWECVTLLIAFPFRFYF